MSAPRGLTGRVVDGRYRLEEALGRGALGTVYRARHLLIERAVAIKLLHPARRGQVGSREAFLHEARTVNRVAHPNVAAIYDFGETQDRLAYLVMELLDGPRLADLLVRGPMPPTAVLDLAAQVASALAHAHDLGVVHCDIKPEHLFLIRQAGRRGLVKLIDFGLARSLAAERGPGEVAIVGTPAYLSPEVARGEEPSPASDLYSLGVVLFEALTGSLPFVSADDAELLRCHRDCPAPDPRERRPELGEEIALLLSRLLRKMPAERFVDAYHLQDNCRVILRGLRLPAMVEAEEPRNPVDSTLRQPPRPELSPVPTAALTASFYGRMLATAYPGGSAPAGLVGLLDAHWRDIAELCKADGELHAAWRWEESVRDRTQVLTEATAVELGALSRTRSQAQREAESATAALPALREAADYAEAERRAAQARAAEAEREADARELHQALADAGAAAARRLAALESITRVETKIRRWITGANQATEQQARLRLHLDRQIAHLDGEREAGQAQVASLARRREEILERLAATGEKLSEHFSRRAACTALLAELDELSLHGASARRPMNGARADRETSA